MLKKNSPEIKYRHKLLAVLYDHFPNEVNIRPIIMEYMANSGLTTKDFYNILQEWKTKGLVYTSDLRSLTLTDEKFQDNHTDIMAKFLGFGGAIIQSKVA